MGKSTELHTAAREGRLEDLKKMLSKEGVDLESTDENDETPLYSACAAGHADVVRVLLDGGAEITGRSSGTFGDDWSYNPVLNVACTKGHIAVVKVLLDKGASLNVATETGCGPLIGACASNKAGVDMVRLLLEYGADPNDHDEYGYTAIMYAMPSIVDPDPHQGHLDKLKILIDSGADVNQPENYYEGNNTPLHKAVLGSDADITRFLLEHGADVHALNKRRETPLQVEYYLPPPKIITLLLDYGGGSARCRKKECGCGLTVDQCCYNHGRLLNTGVGFAGLFGLKFQEHLNTFEKFWTKMKAAGLIPLDDSEKGVVEKYDFWKACKDELARMKTEKVEDTNVAYKDVWNRRPWPLRRVKDLSSEVGRKFPIYQNMIRHRYIVGKKKLLHMDNAHNVFSKFPPPKLSSESIDVILDFLSEDDLKNLADIAASSIENNKRTSPKDLDEPSKASKVPKTDKD